MDEELSSILIIYFNNILKNSLKYRETYNPPIYSRGGNILFTKGKFDDLKNILVSNVNITRQLKDELFDVLKDYYSDLSSINLELSSDGFEIILNRNPLNTLNVDSYVKIVSDLDTVEQLDDFCRSNKGIMRICRTKEFWRNLLKVIYPQSYRGEYNYEAAYKGYLSTLNKDIIRLSDILSDMNVFEYAKFMINEDLITPQNYKKFIIPAIYLNSPSGLGRIIEYAGNVKDISDIIIPEFYEAVKNNNVKYVYNLLIMIANDKRLFSVGGHIINGLRDHVGPSLLSPEMIDALYKGAKYFENITRVTLSHPIVHYVVENAAIFRDAASLLNILDKYKLNEYSIRALLADIRDGIISTSDNITKIIEDYLVSHYRM